MATLVAEPILAPPLHQDSPPLRSALVACDPEILDALLDAGMDAIYLGELEGVVAELESRQPSILISGPLVDDGERRRFGEGIRSSEVLRHLPWMVVAPRLEAPVLEVLLEAGVAGFVLFPAESPLLIAKIRGLASLCKRLRSSPHRRGRPLSGSMGGAGTLPLLKFCEDQRITGRLTVSSDDQTYWLDFRGGEVVHAGSSVTSDADPLGAMLDLRRGHYLIEQTTVTLDPFDGASSDPSPEPPPPASGPQLPAGRLSEVEWRGRSYQIQTEGRNASCFTITTIINRGGRLVRKIESSWRHCLRRHDDYDLARKEIDRQHDSVVRKMREPASQPPPANGNRTVERITVGGLLPWAIHFVVEHVRSHVGTTITESLLSRTHEQCYKRQPALRPFCVGLGTHVEFDSTQGGPPVEAMVAGVCAWMAELLQEAERVLDRAGSIDIRQATALMAVPLEKAGFYQAFEAARARSDVATRATGGPTDSTAGARPRSLVGVPATPAP